MLQQYRIFAPHVSTPKTAVDKVFFTKPENAMVLLFLLDYKNKEHVCKVQKEKKRQQGKTHECDRDDD